MKVIPFTNHHALTCCKSSLLQSHTVHKWTQYSPTRHGALIRSAKISQLNCRVSISIWTSLMGFLVYLTIFQVNLTETLNVVTIRKAFTAWICTINYYIFGFLENLFNDYNIGPCYIIVITWCEGPNIFL